MHCEIEINDNLYKLEKIERDVIHFSKNNQSGYTVSLKTIEIGDEIKTFIENIQEKYPEYFL